MRYLPVIAAVVATAACATPQTRIADALTGYGLAPDRAQCVGGRLQADLSTAQLLELGRAARAYRQGDPDPTRLTLDALTRVSSGVRDPAVPLAVARAAGRCGLVTRPFAA